jgi:hypothetical protein
MLGNIRLQDDHDNGVEMLVWPKRQLSRIFSESETIRDSYLRVVLFGHDVGRCQ